MTFQKRLMVVMALGIFALASYATARHYSPALVVYVVEQSLIQKAPLGIDPALLHERLHQLLSGAPDPKAQMGELLRISVYLEKVQRLTPEELDELLELNTGGGVPGL